MPTIPDQPTIALVLSAALVAGPLLLVVLAAVVVALGSTLVSSEVRRRHTRRVLRDLNDLARILRSRF